MSVVPPDRTAEGVRSVMENLDLLQAWDLADPEYAASLIESWIEISKGNDFGTNYLINTLDLLTTPPDRRAQILLRQSGGRWFPGEEL